MSLSQSLLSLIPTPTSISSSPSPPPSPYNTLSTIISSLQSLPNDAASALPIRKILPILHKNAVISISEQSDSKKSRNATSASRLITLTSLITFYTNAIHRLKAYEPLYETLPDMPQDLISEADADSSYDASMKAWLREELQNRRHLKRQIKETRRQVEQLRVENDAKTLRNEQYARVHRLLRENIVPPFHFKLFPQHMPEMDARVRYLNAEMLTLYNKLAFFTKEHSDFKDSYLSLEGDAEQAKEWLERMGESQEGSEDVSADASNMEDDAEENTTVGDTSTSLVEEQTSSIMDTSNVSSMEPPRKKRKLNSIQQSTAAEDDIFPLRIVLRVAIPNAQQQHPKLTFSFLVSRRLVLAVCDVPPNARSDQYATRGETILQHLFVGDFGLKPPVNVPKSADDASMESLHHLLHNTDWSTFPLGRPYMWAQLLANLTPQNLPESLSASTCTLNNVIARLQERYMHVHKVEGQIDTIVHKKLKLHGFTGVASNVALLNASKHYERDSIRIESLLRYSERGTRYHADIQANITVPRAFPNQTPVFVVRLVDVNPGNTPTPTLPPSLQSKHTQHFDSQLVAQAQRTKLQTQLNDLQLFINNPPQEEQYSVSNQYLNLAQSLNAFFATRDSCVVKYQLDNAPVHLRISRYAEFGVDAAKGMVWSEKENLYRPLG